MAHRFALITAVKNNLELTTKPATAKTMDLKSL